jgi:glycosyltransferase involved in cell wall biosynthesis
MSEGGPSTPPRPVRAAVVGVSEGATCGVHDHAVLLAAGLAGEEIVCSQHWLSRRASSLAGTRAEFRTWGEALPAELAASRAEAAILHYSVFSYSYRGLPLFVAPVLAALRRAGVPVVGLLHEFVYPWRRGGLHGTAWALSQRAVLIEVMRSAAAVVVTTDTGAGWLGSRPWLARRPIAVAPVFSNLPAPGGPSPRSAAEKPLIGLFGYAYEGASLELVLDALALMHGRGVRARLSLLGAPGPDSPAAERWRAGARRRGIEGALEFSGVLPAQDLADALASCELLLHPEIAGPTSRKGTLAGSLASGRPVVAIDGPRRWRELIESEAALVVAPSAAALADGAAALLGDAERREALGARGAAFAGRRMSVEHSAEVVAGVLRAVLDGRPAGAPR